MDVYFLVFVVCVRVSAIFNVLFRDIARLEIIYISVLILYLVRMVGRRVQCLFVFASNLFRTFDHSYWIIYDSIKIDPTTTMM